MCEILTELKKSMKCKRYAMLYARQNRNSYFLIFILYLFQMAYEYLETLNSEQKDAVVHTGSPLLILAGAGSGKTRVITTKIAYLIQHENILPWQILAVTFTKKAANEMKERAVALEPKAAEAQIKTFHSFGAWFLRRYAEYAGLSPSFTVYDDSDSASLIAKAVPSLTKKLANLAAKKIALCKDYCLSPEDDLSGIADDCEFDFPEVYSAYQKRLRETGNADFGDLIMLPVKLLEQNPELRRQIQYRFKVIMVDEYQDSNVAQFRLLEALSGTNEGSGTYVCVVGDDDQSIYKFRGAEIQNILQFPNIFPGTQIIRLEKNYRSTGKILLAADSVVSHNSGRLGKKLVAVNGEGEKPTLVFLENQDMEARLCANIIKNAVSKKTSRYSDFAVLYRTNAQSMEFEHEFLNAKIPYKVVGSLKFYEREEIKDTLAYLSLLANPRDEIAFSRIVNKPGRGIGDKSQEKIIALAHETSPIETSPHETANSISESLSENTSANLSENLSDTENPSAVLSESISSAESFDLIQTAENASKNLPKKAQEGIKEFVSVMKNLKNELLKNSEEAEKSQEEENVIPSPLSFFISRLAEESGLLEYHKAQDKLDGTSRAENMEELSNYAAKYPCTLLGLLDFLDTINLDRTLSEDEEEKDDAVTLITLHNTKGLEFERVIITGLENGIFPREDKFGADLEEERRLFYVGITRAKKELTITSCRTRRLYGRFQEMLPSVFLKEAEDAFDIQGARKQTEGETHYFASKDDLLKEKYKKGTKIYHDDYGYGIVVQQNASSENLVITVAFESGGQKKFIPQYQAKSLQIIRE